MIKKLINYLWGLIFGFSWTRDCYVIYGMNPDNSIRAGKYEHYEREMRG
jgi:hypothetical protein